MSHNRTMWLDLYGEDDVDEVSSSSTNQSPDQNAEIAQNGVDGSDDGDYYNHSSASGVADTDAPSVSSDSSSNASQNTAASLDSIEEPSSINEPEPLDISDIDYDELDQVLNAIDHHAEVSAFNEEPPVIFEVPYPAANPDIHHPEALDLMQFFDIDGLVPMEPADFDVDDADWSWLDE